MKKLVFKAPEDYLALITRRKWWVIVSFVLLGTAVGLVSLLLPNRYVSETLILVEPREVPGDVVKDFVTVSTQERLTAIQQTVLSRTNLLRIINEFKDRFKNLDLMTDDQKVELLRKRTNIEVTSTRTNRGTAVAYFRISFEDRDPSTAQLIASRLASLFIEFDAKNREAQVFGTASFLQSELDKVSSQMHDVDAALASFKRQYQNELPDQLDTNLRNLDRLQAQMKTNMEAYDRNLSMRLDLERQLSETPAVTSKEVALDGGQPDQPPSSLVQGYQKKLQQYNELLTRYTFKHPDVRRLKAELDELKKQIPPADLAHLQQSTEPASKTLTQPNPVYQRLTSQLNQVETELQILRKSRDSIQKEILIYEARVKNTPRREQEIAQTQRRSDDLSAQYKDLKKKLDDARMAESLESRQKGEQFQIVDPANLPIHPAKPNRLLILLAGLVGSLGVGVGLALGADFADQKVWTQNEVETLLGVPVIVEIPEIPSEDDLRRRRNRRIAHAFLFVLFCLMCVGGAYLFYHTSSLRDASSETLVRLLKW